MTWRTGLLTCEDCVFTLTPPSPVEGEGAWKEELPLEEMKLKGAQDSLEVKFAYHFNALTSMILS